MPLVWIIYASLATGSSCLAGLLSQERQELCFPRGRLIIPLAIHTYVQWEDINATATKKELAPAHHAEIVAVSYN